MQIIYKIIKRGFDLISSILLFILIFPLFLILCLLVRVNLGSPIFFSQERSGYKQKKFKMIKFRTMTNERNLEGELLPDECRQTTFGQFLRSTSLDELPELLSIIKGDMSVIGPRPLPPFYDEYYTKRELKRFEVRGGLLPPDSVESSAVITWDKQLEYEASYAENLSLKNDFRIFFKALKILFTRKATNYGSYVRQSLVEERTKNEILKK